MLRVASMSIEYNLSTGHIALKNLPNVRDLGYLMTERGERIVPQRLIRAGALGEASDGDIEILVNGCQIRTIIDLRTPEESAQNPDPRNKMPQVDFFDAPILGFSTTGITREDGLLGMMKSYNAITRKDPRQLMTEVYENMLLSETGLKGFSRFFEILTSKDEGAILWHCSAGKDRAGLAAVLLLTVLGVSRSTIVADYLATNLNLAGRAVDLKKHIPKGLLSKAVLKSLEVFNSADEAFLDAGIMAVKKEYESLNGYLKNALGVDDDKRKLLYERFVCL